MWCRVRVTFVVVTWVGWEMFAGDLSTDGTFGTVTNACLWPVCTCSIYGMLCALLTFTCPCFCRRSVAALSTCDGDVCGVKNFPIFFKNLYLRGTALLHKGELFSRGQLECFEYPTFFLWAAMAKVMAWVKLL